MVVILAHCRWPAKRLSRRGFVAVLHANGSINFRLGLLRMAVDTHPVVG